MSINVIGSYPFQLQISHSNLQISGHILWRVLLYSKDLKAHSPGK